MRNRKRHTIVRTDRETDSVQKKLTMSKYN